MSAIPKAVFLSYAHEDADAAKQVAEALRTAGVEVWFDQSELRGGDAWDRKIKKQIKECALFVPVVSRNTQARKEGYFRLEWRHAEQRTHLMGKNAAFLVPVCVDGTKDEEADVPDAFLEVQWTRLAKAQAQDGFDALALGDFAQHVKNLIACGDIQFTSMPFTMSGAPMPSDAPRIDPVAPVRATTPATEGRRVPVAVWILVAAVIVAALIYFFFVRKSPNAGAGTRPPALSSSNGPTAEKAAPPKVEGKSIAVLSFKNQSPDPANAFFADGIHEDILTNLAHVRELRVVSSTTVEQYRDSKKTVRQIGTELGVAWVLEGSVQRAGNQIHMNAQLIDARTDEHVWAETFDRDLTDIFTMQSELALKITSSLKAVLSPEEKSLLERKPTESLAAYELFSKVGREIASNPSLSDRAIFDRFEPTVRSVVQLDPNFLDAWGVLLGSYSFNYANSYHTPELMEKAKAAYAEVMRLGPDSRTAMLQGARYFLWALNDFDRATEAAERFIRAQPNDPGGYFALEIIQFRQGKLAEAVTNLRKACALEPTNWNFVRQLFGPLEGCRRYEELIQEIQKVLKMRPDLEGDRPRLAFAIFRGRGSTREADEYFSSLPADKANSPEVLAQRKDLAMVREDWAEFLRLDALIPETKGNAGVTRALGVALVLAAKGDTAAARARLTPLETEAIQRAEKNPTTHLDWRNASQVAAMLGHAEEAQRCLQELETLPPEQVNAPRTLAENTRTRAFVFTWLGDKTRAIEEYRKLFGIVFGKSERPRNAPPSALCPAARRSAV